MRVVVGLGNPGSKYERARHNAGFWVIDKLADAHGITRWQSKWSAMVSECRIGPEKVLLCKPQTYMNLSGESLSQIFSFYSEMTVERDLIVIYDDMDFSVGQLKLRASGRAGGHNGIKSIIHELKTEQFARIRVGIGRPEGRIPVVNYVLAEPSDDEWTLLHPVIQRAADAVTLTCEQGFELAMNRFNVSLSDPAP